MTGFSSKPYFFWHLLGLACALPFIFLTSPVFAQFENADQRVLDLFEVAHKDLCISRDDEGGPNFQSWDMQFSYDFDPEQMWDYRLYRIHCFNGAYNEIHVYYGFDHNQEIAQIYFPMPELDIIYKNDDYEQSSYTVDVEGFYADFTLVNSEFDPQEQTIYAYSKWRGIGDASSIGEWAFDQGKFVLKSYDVDASYDGKFEMKRVYGLGQPVR